MKKSIKIILLFVTTFFLSSCVSMKKFNETRNGLISENRQMKMEFEIANAELSGKVDLLTSQNRELRTQLDDALYNLNIQRQSNNVLQKENTDLQNQLNRLKIGTSAEIEKLMADLQITRNDLNVREDKLHEAERELDRKNARLIELQNILAQQEQAVKELKDKVLNALVGFNNNGLTVHEKNGKVYVSLDERLLFRTGRWDVDPNGQRALRELSNVLAQNKDINIMVEGHTDDVPMRGSGDVKDNWDLSVMRATAVTKILTQNNNIDPRRIIAAGRSEYMPLSPEKTTEGRQMNRRTEIILTPNIDELLKIIDMN